MHAEREGFAAVTRSGGSRTRKSAAHTRGTDRNVQIYDQSREGLHCGARRGRRTGVIAGQSCEENIPAKDSEEAITGLLNQTLSQTVRTQNKNITTEGKKWIRAEKARGRRGVANGLPKAR